MKLKSILAIILCTTSIFLFSGCNTAKNDSTSQDAVIQETDTNKPDTSESTVINEPDSSESVDVADKSDSSESADIDEPDTNVDDNKPEIDNKATDYPDAPDGLIINDYAFDEWESENSLMLFPFMSSTEFSFSIPTGQASSQHKTCVFYFNDNDKLRKLEDVEFYYAVEKQKILYTGLDTNDESILESADFREACVRLMLGYNATFDADADATIPNISRERAEDIVNFCIDNKIRCIVDDMRIRVVEQPEDNFYSFHIEY